MRGKSIRYHNWISMFSNVLHFGDISAGQCTFCGWRRNFGQTPRTQTKANEFIPCSNDICHILKRFRNFKTSIIPFILPKSLFKLSVARSHRSGKESGRRPWSPHYRHSDFPFSSWYIAPCRQNLGPDRICSHFLSESSSWSIPIMENFKVMWNTKKIAEYGHL